MQTMIQMVVLALAIGAAGCNTVKGVGQDRHKDGEKIEDASKKM